MTGNFNIRFALTDPTERLGIFLTLLFFAVFSTHAHSAIDSNSPFAAYGLHPVSAIDVNEENTRRDALNDYLKQQALLAAPNLPDSVKSIAKSAMNRVQAASGFLSFDFSTLDQPDAAPAPNFAGLMQGSGFNDPSLSPLIASTGYHHRHGILPTRDALLMGTHMHQDFGQGYALFDAHPYYGQNYFSSRGYYGAELSLNLASPSDTRHATRPWGTVSIGYTNGDDRLMDHGRGLDVHSELNMTDHLSLNSGLRQSDTTGAGNYVLLQWKLALQ